MRPLVLTACLLTLVGCASAGRGSSGGAAIPPVGAESEVIAVAEALFSAMRARDTTAIRELFVPESQIAAIRMGAPSAAAPQMRSAEEFVASIGRPGETLAERMWDPQVRIDGDLATLWAPYEFHLGDRFSHCGSDAFHLVRADGRWRIVALTYTIQTIGCTGGA